MKKRQVRFATVLVFSLLIAFLVGCAEINTDAYVFQSQSSVITSSLKSVKLVVSSNDSLLSVSSSRTITPDAYNSSDLNFYLGGKNVGDGTNLPVQKATFVADEGSTSKGTIIVPLNSYNYQLVLIAIPAATDTTTLASVTYIESLLSSAVLFGTTTADLRYNDSSSVNFYLSSDGLTRKGAFKLNFYLSNWSAESLAAVDSTRRLTVTSGVAIDLYSCSTGESVDGSCVASANFSGKTSTDNTFSYVNNEIAPGTYELVLTFSYNDHSFVYNEKIMILPYQTTTAVIAVPDVLQNVPAAPTDLKQGYLKPLTDDSNYYRVIFSWTDNANTETHFKLQLLDVTTNSNVTTTTANTATLWASNSTETNPVDYETEFYGGSEWYAGSLSRNSNFAIFYVPLGSRYLARVCAVNDVGDSDWAYASSEAVSVTVAGGESTAESASLGYSQTFTATAFNSNVINLFRITYNVVGGTFSPSSLPKVYYFDQLDDGNPILAPNGTTTNSAYNSGNAVTLTLGTSAWDYWRISTIAGSIYPNNSDDVPENYLGYKNLSLYAIYEEDTSTTPTVIDYSIKNNMTFYAIADGETVSVTNNSLFTVPAGTNSVVFSFTYATNDFRYDSISLTVSENGGADLASYTTTGQTFSIPIGTLGLESGVYSLTVAASVAGTDTKASVIMIIQ